jgi:predicted transglutaminase-like protease
VKYKLVGKFTMGLGVVGLAWLFKKQIRSVAVKGTKGLLLTGYKAKSILETGKVGIEGIIDEAESNKIKEKLNRSEYCKEEVELMRSKLDRITTELEAMKGKMEEEELKEKQN